MMSTLRFLELREANLKRCPEVFHPLHDWSIQDWACAMASECGEACNIAKKLKRYATKSNTDKDPLAAKAAMWALARELADVVIYADLLAARIGADLGEEITKKFNDVSHRMKSSVFLKEKGD